MSNVTLGCIGACAEEYDPPCYTNLITFNPRPAGCVRINGDPANPITITDYFRMFDFLEAYCTPIPFNEELQQSLCVHDELRPDGAFCAPEEIFEYETMNGGPIVPGTICVFLLFDPNDPDFGPRMEPTSFAMGLEYEEGSFESGINLLLYGHDVGTTGNIPYCGNVGGMTLQTFFSTYGFYSGGEEYFEFVKLYEPCVSAEFAKKLTDFMQGASNPSMPILEGR